MSVVWRGGLGRRAPCREAHQKTDFQSFEEDPASGAASAVFPGFCPPAPARALRAANTTGLLWGSCWRRGGSRESPPLLL